MPPKPLNVIKLLLTIHKYNGVVPKTLLKEMFWKGKTTRAMDIALKKLVNQNLIKTDGEEERRKYYIPEPVVWLASEGMAKLCAEAFQVKVTPPVSDKPATLASYRKRLNKYHIGWRTTPLSNLNHDLSGLKCRLKIEQEIEDLQGISILDWYTENKMRTLARFIDVDYPDGIKQKKVYPDDVAIFENTNDLINGQPTIQRSLFEYDMGSRFSWENVKARPGEAYIQSDNYKDIFGYNSGTFRIITTTEQRLKLLMEKTKNSTSRVSKYWSFTTFDEALNPQNNILTSPIWRRYRFERNTPIIEYTAMFHV